MGVSIRYYTIYGVKLEYNKKLSSSLYEEAMDDDDCPFILSDGMNGKYTILGKVLYNSGDLRWGDDGDDYVEVDLDSLSDYETQYRQEFIAKFPNFATLLDHPFKLMTLVHYS